MTHPPSRLLNLLAWRRGETRAIDEQHLGFPKNPQLLRADTGLIHLTPQASHMRIPARLQEVDRQEAIIREYEHDNTTAITADFGSAASDISIDIVDETAIVVVSGEQFEFELPDDADEIAAKNGVLTIEG